MITCLRPPTSMRSFCCHDLWLPRTHSPHPAVTPKGRGQVHSEKEDVAGALGSGTVALRFGGESWGLTAQPGPPPNKQIPHSWGPSTEEQECPLSPRWGAGRSCPVLLPFHLFVQRGSHFRARRTGAQWPAFKTGTAASPCDGMAAAIAAAAIWGLCPQQAQ